MFTHILKVIHIACLLFLTKIIKSKYLSRAALRLSTKSDDPDSSLDILILVMPATECSN